MSLSVKIVKYAKRYVGKQFKKYPPPIQEPGWSHRKLASKYGVSKSAITALLQGDTWDHL